MKRLLPAVFCLAALIAVTPMTTSFAQTVEEDDTRSTKQRKEAEKERAKQHKEFNREIQYRRVIGPRVLPVGPFSISLFVRGQPMEARIRVAIQATTEQNKVTLDGQKWAVNGIVYPLAVRLFENGRPDREQIELFKTDARDRLSKRFPDMIDEVFIESLI